MSASDADKVRQVVREYLAQRDSPCPKCGYNLRGLDNDKCPECGQPAALAIIADERRQREAAARAEARRKSGPWWLGLPGLVWVTVYIGVSFLKGPGGIARHPRIPTWLMFAVLGASLIGAFVLIVPRRKRLAASAPGRLAALHLLLMIPAVVAFLLWAL